MDILSYLTELINTRKEVGVSGLGSFYKRKSPGRYDSATHSFLPPSYTLAFTEDIREDISLISFISKKKGISPETTAYYINQFVEETLKQISDNQQVDLGGLGTLTGNPGSIMFNPKDQINFGFDFYGLPLLKEKTNVEPVTESDFSSEQLELENSNADLSDGLENLEESDHNNDSITHDDQPVYDEISEVNLTENPKSIFPIETVENIDVSDQPEELITQRDNVVHAIDPTPPLDQPLFDLEETEEPRQGLPLYLKVIIAFTGIIIIGIILFLVKPELYNGVLNRSDNATKNQNSSTNEKLKTDSIAYADSIRIANEKAIKTVDSVKDSMAVNPALPQNNTDTNLTVTWEVIGASVINQKEAARFIAQMKAIGITAKVVPNMPGKRRIKISIATFKDEESAKEGRKLLVSKLKDPGIYIYQNKHTHKSQ